MQKQRVFQKKCIVLIMAVMLMFSAFAAGSNVADSMFVRADDRPGQGTMLRPEAGEFFAGSLPQVEPESVRETTVHWQELLCSRGQSARFQLCAAFEAIALPPIAEHLKRKDRIKEKTVHHSSEIIVCYIHNKDGQKG